jgi:hypothetical protein
VGGQEALAEKCGVDAVTVVAFAYDTYTTPSKNNGVLRATLTLKSEIALECHYIGTTSDLEQRRGRDGEGKIK